MFLTLFTCTLKGLFNYHQPTALTTMLDAIFFFSQTHPLFHDSHWLQLLAQVRYEFIAFLQPEKAINSDNCFVEEGTPLKKIS